MAIQAQTFDDFETWRKHNDNEPFNYEYSTKWLSSNGLTEFAELSILKSEDAYEGQYAMEIRSVNVLGEVVPGVVTTYSAKIDYLTNMIDRQKPGINLTAQPTKVTGAYKYSGDNPYDSGSITVTVFRDINGSFVNNFENTITLTHTNEYELFTLPIELAMPFDEDLDMLRITFSSSILSENLNAATLLIDDLELESLVSTSEIAYKIDQIELRPNLLGRGDIIELRSSYSSTESFYISNSKGDKIEDFIEISPLGQINLKTSNLPCGKYFVCHAKSNKIWPFIVQ